MIEFTIKTLDSQDHHFSVDDGITVEELKHKIREKLGIEVNSQRLIFCGRLLQNENRLAEYQVNNKVVHLVEQAPPSSEEQQRASTSRGTTNTQRRTFVVHPTGPINWMDHATTVAGCIDFIHIMIQELRISLRELEEAQGINTEEEVSVPPNEEHEEVENDGDHVNDTGDDVSEPRPRNAVRISFREPMDLANAIEELDTLHMRFAPHRRIYISLLQRAHSPEIACWTREQIESNQRVIDLVIDTIHSFAHTYHAVSDIMYRLGQHPQTSPESGGNTARQTVNMQPQTQPTSLPGQPQHQRQPQQPQLQRQPQQPQLQRQPQQPQLQRQPQQPQLQRQPQQPQLQRQPQQPQLQRQPQQPQLQRQPQQPPLQRQPQQPQLQRQPQQQGTMQAYSPPVLEPNYRYIHGNHGFTNEMPGNMQANRSLEIFINISDIAHISNINSMPSATSANNTQPPRAQSQNVRTNSGPTETHRTQPPNSRTRSEPPTRPRAQPPNGKTNSGPPARPRAQPPNNRTNSGAPEPPRAQPPNSRTNAGPPEPRAQPPNDRSNPRTPGFNVCIAQVPSGETSNSEVIQNIVSSMIGQGIIPNADGVRYGFAQVQGLRIIQGPGQEGENVHRQQDGRGQATAPLTGQNARQSPQPMGQEIPQPQANENSNQHRTGHIPSSRSTNSSSSYTTPSGDLICDRFAHCDHSLSLRRLQRRRYLRDHQQQEEMVARERSRQAHCTAPLSLEFIFQRSQRLSRVQNFTLERLLTATPSPASVLNSFLVVVARTIMASETLENFSTSEQDQDPHEFPFVRSLLRIYFCAFASVESFVEDLFSTFHDFMNRLPHIVRIRRDVDFVASLRTVLYHRLSILLRMVVEGCPDNLVVRFYFTFAKFYIALLLFVEQCCEGGVASLRFLYRYFMAEVIQFIEDDQDADFLMNFAIEIFHHYMFHRNTNFRHIRQFVCTRTSPTQTNSPSNKETDTSSDDDVVFVSESLVEGVTGSFPGHEPTSSVAVNPTQSDSTNTAQIQTMGVDNSQQLEAQTPPQTASDTADRRARLVSAQTYTVHSPIYIHRPTSTESSTHTVPSSSNTHIAHSSDDDVVFVSETFLERRPDNSKDSEKNTATSVPAAQKVTAPPVPQTAATDRRHRFVSSRTYSVHTPVKQNWERAWKHRIPEDDENQSSEQSGNSSDAYLSGTPPTRKRMVRRSRPTNNVDGFIDGSVSEPSNSLTTEVISPVLRRHVISLMRSRYRRSEDDSIRYPHTACFLFDSDSEQETEPRSKEERGKKENKHRTPAAASSSSEEEREKNDDNEPQDPGPDSQQSMEKN